jgi:transposase
MALPRECPEPKTLEEAKEIIRGLWGFVETCERLTARVEQLETENAELKAQVQELLDKAGKSSRNSSKPPSSDSTAQRAKRPKKKPSSKNRGAQPGHKGHQRALLDESEVDDIKRHFPQTHCGCGGAVHVGADPRFRHQVFDLPEIKFTVTEHQVFDGICDTCHQEHEGRWPDSIPSGQLGPTLIAWIVMMSSSFHLSIRQIQQLLAEQWQLQFSVGAISEAQGKALPWLAPLYQDIGEHIRQEDVVHADETRYFLDAECRWLWALASKSCLYLMAHYSRGMGAADVLLQGFKGYLVTDHYAGYNHYPREKRQLCWAHLIRHFRSISERPEFSGRVGHRLLLIANLVFRTRHRWERQEITEPIYRRRMERLREHFEFWLDLGSSGVADKRTTRQCRHLKKDQALCWTFLKGPKIPLTNNTAEQGLRAYVIWRKLSFAVHSGRGECYMPMSQSVVGTAKRLKISTYKLLRQASNEYVITGRVITRLPLCSQAPTLPT